MQFAFGLRTEVVLGSPQDATYWISGQSETELLPQVTLLQHAGSRKLFRLGLFPPSLPSAPSKDPDEGECVTRMPGETAQ